MPIDLNALLFHLEQRLTLVYHIEQNIDKKAFILNVSRSVICRTNLFMVRGSKFLWTTTSVNTHTPVISVAGMYALAFYMGTVQQEAAAAKTFEKELLKAGGVVSTPTDGTTMGCAERIPLQWMSIRGLRQYNQFELADQVTLRWLNRNRDVFQQELKLVEKYDVMVKLSRRWW